MYKFIIAAWILGLFVSLAIGQVVISAYLVRLRRYVERRRDEWKKFPKKQKQRFRLGIDIYPPDNPPDERDTPLDENPVHPIIIGFLERLFFTIIVAVNLGGAAVSMVAWIALKMVAARPHRKERTRKSRNAISSAEAPALRFEFAGLFGNLMSMLFALIGGLIIRLIQWIVL